MVHHRFIIVLGLMLVVGLAGATHAADGSRGSGSPAASHVERVDLELSGMG